MTTIWERLCVGLGALAGLSAVAMAAAASHALASRLGPTELAALHSAVEMLGWHALALLFCGLWVTRGGILARAAASWYLAISLRDQGRLAEAAAIRPIRSRSTAAAGTGRPTPAPPWPPR